MKVYLAGPMRGIPEFNHPAFKKAAAHLRREGYEVFSPAEQDFEILEDFKTNKAGDEVKLAVKLQMTPLQLRRKVFEADFNWICREADAIAMLPGWEQSSGAQAEWACARALGLKIIYLS